MIINNLKSNGNHSYNEQQTAFVTMDHILLMSIIS